MNELSKIKGEGFFNHNVQSVRLLMNIENNGDGKNITVQVLDAIFCHNGEMFPIQRHHETFEWNQHIQIRSLNLLLLSHTRLHSVYHKMICIAIA